MLLKHSFDQGDYERFQTYFTDAQRNKISKEQFRELSELATAGWGHDTYSVITFENGEKLLINTVKDLEDGYYKIQDIKRVPEEWKELFIR